MTTLLAQMDALSQQVSQLATLFASLENPLIAHVVARTSELEGAIRALPTERDALRWWLWYSQTHHLRNLLTPIQGYARLMHIQPGQLGRESFTTEEAIQFERVNAEANALNELLTAFVDEMRTIYQAEAETPPQAIALHRALDRVWPILRYSLRDTAVALVPQIDPTLRPVLYHHLHTTALIQHLVSMMGREWMAYGPLTMSTQAEEQSVALRLAATGLRITAEQWEGLFKTAGDEVYYKRLVALGGTLEQIDPRGTQEGGMILRLPYSPLTSDAPSEHPNDTQAIDS
jgi:hypothetical protein